jgi:starch phosphorylase
LNKGLINHDDHWETKRTEIQYNIGFYGRVEEDEQGRKVWEPECLVKAVAYDIPIPGFKTRNTNILRLFHAEPIEK